MPSPSMKYEQLGADDRSPPVKYISNLMQISEEARRFIRYGALEAKKSRMHPRRRKL